MVRKVPLSAVNANPFAGAVAVDSWLSAIEANTSRGRAEIAASSDRINHSLELAIPESSAQRAF
jgi:hypothetical protein